MTERLFETSDFWEEIYPNNDRRTRVKTFVESICSGIERIEKVLLIRFKGGAEKLYLFLNPPTPDENNSDPKGLGIPLHLSGPRTLKPAQGIVMTTQEMHCITDTMNDNFSESGWEIKDWPWPFEFTEDSYQALLRENKSIRGAEKFTLWERQKKTA